MLYGAPYDNSTPDYDEWCEGREELKDSIELYFHTLEEIPIEPSNATEAREYYEKLVSKMCELRKLVVRMEELEDEYPPEYQEPEPDWDSMPGGHDWVD